MSRLLNHTMPTWLFAEAIGRMKEMDYDREVVAVGTVRHDISLVNASFFRCTDRASWLALALETLFWRGLRLQHDPERGVL